MKYNQLFYIAVVMLFFQSVDSAGFSSGKEVTFPEIQGLVIEYNYPVFTGEDLWDYINGASDGYLAYHFQQLKIAEYKEGNGNVVKVEVYEHLRPEDAYGIYSTERSPDYFFVDIGAEGYAETGLVNFVTGNYYVKVIVGSGATVSKEKTMEIASAVSKSLADKPSLPAELSFFAGDGKVPHSESFIAGNVLGNEFLNDAFILKYKAGETAFSIILFERNQPDDVLMILKDYIKYTKQEVPASWGNGPYILEDKYNGTIHFYLQNNVLFGFMELDDQTIIDRYTGEILKNLKK